MTEESFITSRIRKKRRAAHADAERGVQQRHRGILDGGKSRTLDTSQTQAYVASSPDTGVGVGDDVTYKCFNFKLMLSLS